jgi:hypothetical protein
MLIKIFLPPWTDDVISGDNLDLGVAISLAEETLIE